VLLGKCQSDGVRDTLAKRTCIKKQTFSPVLRYRWSRVAVSSAEVNRPVVTSTPGVSKFSG
jgi:hypothetical protein